MGQTTVVQRRLVLSKDNMKAKLEEHFGPAYNNCAATSVGISIVQDLCYHCRKAHAEGGL